MASSWSCVTCRKVSPDFGLDRLEFELHLTPQLQVERAERLVEQEQRRPVHDRAGERHPLLLTAGELAGPARRDVVELDEPQRLVRLRDGIRDPSAPQSERDVLDHGHVRKQRIALEHRVDRTLVGLHGRHVLPADQDAPCRGIFESRDEAERRGLSASRRAEQREERPGRNEQIELFDRGEAGKDLADPLELQIRAGLGECSRSHRQAPRPTASNCGVVLLLLLVRECAEDVRLRERLLVREDQLVLQRAPGRSRPWPPVHPRRGDVVHPGGDLGGHERVVVVVDELLDVALLLRADRDHEVVAPERAAGVGQGEPELVADLGVDRGDVARPDDRRQGVLVLEVVGVRVALDVADLPARDLLLEDGQRVVELGVAPARARDVDTLAQHDEPHRVAHLAQHAHATLELGVPQVLDALQALRQLLLVPRDAGEARLPRQRVRAAGIEVGFCRLGLRFATALGMFALSKACV